MEEIFNPKIYFDKLGDMHDSIIKSFRIDFLKKSLQVDVEDIYSNFVGLPEYQGITPSLISFSNISSIELTFNILENDLYEINIEDIDKDKYKIKLSFYPDGIISFYCSKIFIEIQK